MFTEVTGENWGIFTRIRLSAIPTWVNCCFSICHSSWMTCSPKNSMKTSAPLSQSEQLYMTQARPEVLGITGIRYLEPFSYRYMLFFCHSSGIKDLVFPWFWVFSSWTWIKRLFFSRSGSSCRVVFYNFEVFWYLMGRKSGILVSHYPP